MVYEDDHLLVINKAAGMVIHPAPGNYTGTLVSALLHRFGLPSVRLSADDSPGALLLHCFGVFGGRSNGGRV